jgi:hypothetical protein
MTVWFQYRDCPEVGPIELTADEAAELGDQMERATRVLSVASERDCPLAREAGGHDPKATGTPPAARKLRLV